MVRYAIKFKTIQKELKKAKILKVKKRYNLLEAEQILSACYDELESLGHSSLKLTLDVIEVDQNEVFEFDDLTVPFRENRELLIDVLTTDIYQSMEQANDEDQELLEALAEGLQEQAEKEYSHPELYENQAKKAPFSLKVPFFKKKNGALETIQPYNALWDQEEPQEKEKTADLSQSVSVQMEREELEEPTEIVYESDEEEGLIDTEEVLQKQKMDAQEKKQQQKIDYVARVNGTHRQDSFIRPETSTLTSLETYANLNTTETLEAVETVLASLKEETSNEDTLLFERFGVDGEEKELSPLQLKKKAYLNLIKQPNFTVSLLSNFEKNIQALKKKANHVLISKYQLTREVSPEEAIEEKLTQYKEQLALKADMNVKQVLERIDQECQSEEKQLSIKHENELNALKMKQKSEREVVEQRFAQRKRTEEDLATEENKRIYKLETEEKRAELITEEKIKREEELLLLKNQTLEGFSTGLQDVIRAMKDTQTAYYDDLEVRIKEQEENWKKEVTTEQRLLMRKTEQQIAEEQNRLKEKELRLLEETAEKQLNLTRNKETVLQDILESNDQLQQKQREERRRNQDFQEMMEQALRTMQEKNQVPQDPQPEVVQPSQEEKKKKRVYLPIVTGFCGVIIAGGLFFGYSELQGVRAKNQELQQSVIQLKEDSVKQVEKDKEEQEEPIIEETTLEDLLKDKKYMEAAEAFPDQLDVIENQLFKDKEIAQLTAFNVLYKSKNGVLNQAILEGNNEKIIEAFEQNETKDTLSKDQEKSVALAYFATGKTEEGTKLITK